LLDRARGPSGPDPRAEPGGRAGPARRPRQLRERVKGVLLLPPPPGGWGRGVRGVGGRSRIEEGVMASHASPPPAGPHPPRGINPVALTVRGVEVSRRFWTEILGFRCVAQLQPIPGHRPRMRFYSGVDAEGRVTHHDVALAEIAPADGTGAPAPWSLSPG